MIHVTPIYFTGIPSHGRKQRAHSSMIGCFCVTPYSKLAPNSELAPDFRFVLHLLKIVWNEFTIVCRLILLTNFNCQLQTDCSSKSKQPYFSWKRIRLSFISKSCLKIGLQNLVTSFRNGNLTVGLSALHINSLGPCDAIWRQRSGSTLAQVMACCLTAPSHYLNHCRLIFSKVEWHSLKGKFTRDTSAINHWNYL